MSNLIFTVISQPRYMPALNYFHRMASADQFIYLDNVQYTPRDWENRNKVKGPSGPTWLSVPVVHENREQKIMDTKIDIEQKWASRHLRTIYHFYGKTRYFKDHIDFFETLYEKKWIYLIDLNGEIIKYFCDVWDIDCRFTRASELDVKRSGEDLLIGLCKKTNTKTYISGTLGRRYIHPEKWHAESLELLYHDYNYPAYEQPYGQFLPWMGCIDLLMNCGKAGRDILHMGECSLIKG